MPWEASNDEHILNKVRYEIARSLARGRGETPPPHEDPEAVLDWLARHAPPVCDPSAAAARSRWRRSASACAAYGSDLTPVAVLVSKATCEIPPKFASLQPVNPDRDPHVAWKGARGLAEDIRHYGRWMRDDAESRIGHLYPKVQVTDAMTTARPRPQALCRQGADGHRMALARTVASPDPMLRGAHVPLVRSFVLSSEDGKPSLGRARGKSSVRHLPLCGADRIGRGARRHGRSERRPLSGNGNARAIHSYSH